MYQQIRLAAPASSPPNLERVLEILSPYNLVAAGGSNIEHGGDFAFTVDPAQQAAVVQALTASHIQHRVVDVIECWVDDAPGALLTCVRDANKNNRPGRLIRDISVGTIRNDQNQVLVLMFYDHPGPG